MGGWGGSSFKADCLKVTLGYQQLPLHNEIRVLFTK